jgi:hypothetical protein
MWVIFHALPFADAQRVVNKIPERDKYLIVLCVLQHNKFTGHISLMAETMQHHKFLPASVTGWPTDYERRAQCFT